MEYFIQVSEIIHGPTLIDSNKANNLEKLLENMFR